MNTYLNLLGGLVCLALAVWLLQERNASRIRRSRYWFIGWAGYMLAILGAFNCLAPFLPEMDDATFVPAFLGVVATIMVGVGLWLWWSHRRLLKAARG